MPPLPQQSRECQCPRARHQHGTRQAYQRDECRCPSCRSAHALHARRRRLRIAVHAWNGGSDWTRSLPTVLRLRALAADGWTLADLAPLLGITRTAVAALRADESPRMLAATAARVHDVYDALGLPEPTRGRLVAQRRAQAKGWLSSAALDGDIMMRLLLADVPFLHMPIATTEDHLTARIVDDVLVERRIAGDPVPLTRAELSQAWQTLERMGWSAAQIGVRLGVSSRTVQRYRQRRRAA